MRVGSWNVFVQSAKLSTDLCLHSSILPYFISFHSSFLRSHASLNAVVVSVSVSVSISLSPNARLSENQRTYTSLVCLAVPRSASVGKIYETPQIFALYHQNLTMNGSYFRTKYVITKFDYAWACCGVLYGSTEVQSTGGTKVLRNNAAPRCPAVPRRIRPPCTETRARVAGTVPWGVDTPPPPAPLVRPEHPSIRRGVRQFNRPDSSTVVHLSQQIARTINPQHNDLIRK